MSVLTQEHHTTFAMGQVKTAFCPGFSFWIPMVKLCPKGFTHMSGSVDEASSDQNKCQANEYTARGDPF